MTTSHRTRYDASTASVALLAMAMDRRAGRAGWDGTRSLGEIDIMSDRFVLISWTPYKKRYDAVALASVAIYIGVFFLIGSVRWGGLNSISPEILLIRATGTAAIVLLHVILSIGPLARLDHRFLPLLYNRRHLGVMTFFVALVHAVLVLGF